MSLTSIERPLTTIRTVVAFDDRAILEANRRVEGGFERAFRRNLSGAADVERTHRELRARFADRLSGDDADSFTDVDARAARQVTTVARSAGAIAAFAGQHRTNQDAVDAGLVDQGRDFLVQVGVGRSDDLCRFAGA